MKYLPSKTIKEFMLCEANVKCIIGPLGSGKSMGALMELFRRMIEQEPDAKGVRPTRFALVRNTLAQLRDTTLADARQYFEDFFEYRVSEQTLKFRFNLEDGTRVESDWMLVPLERPEDQRKLLSLNLTAAWIEECREVPFDIVSAVRGRVGRYPSKARVPPTWQGLLLVSNPWSVSSEYHENFVINKPDGWAFYRQPGGMSPEAENVQYLPDGYYDRLMEGATDEWIKVHVHAEFGDDQFGQAVFKGAFNQDLHLADETPYNPMIPILIGMDLGRTPAAVFTQEDMHGRIVVMSELVSNDIHLPGFLDMMLIPHLYEHYPEARVFLVADPAGNARSQFSDMTSFDIFKEKGLRAIPAPTNDVQPRINAVEKLLLRNTAPGRGLIINRRMCPTLTRGFMRDYRFKKRRDGELTPAPEKNDASHVHDAMQYAALGHQSSFVAKRVLRETRMPSQRRTVPFSAKAWT